MRWLKIRMLLRRRRARGGTLPGLARAYRQGDGKIVMIHLSGRHTVKRPDETWSQAMNRLLEGEDL